MIKNPWAKDWIVLTKYKNKIRYQWLDFGTWFEAKRAIKKSLIPSAQSAYKYSLDGSCPEYFIVHKSQLSQQYPELLEQPLEY